MYDQYKHNDCNESLKNELISTLPVQGIKKEKTILPFLPFSRTTLHEWSRDGRFPASIRLSTTVVAWRNSEVLKWIESHSTSSNDKEA